MGNTARAAGIKTGYTRSQGLLPGEVSVTTVRLGFTTVAAAVAFSTLFALSSCKSAPPPRTDPTEPSSITALAGGFSPSGTADSMTIGLKLDFGNRDAAKSWRVAIVNGLVTVKEFFGLAPDLPESIAWDGRTAAMAIWPEGEYSAYFTVDYGDAFNPSPVSKTKFVLISGPPLVKLEASPKAFTPAVSGMAEPVAITLNASSHYASIKSWVIDVLDSQGDVIRKFSGEGAAAKLSWDGRTAGNSWVEPSKLYTAWAKATDLYGNVGEASLGIVVYEQPDAPEKSAIKAQSSGFSPTGEAGRRTMNLALSVGNRSSLRAWTVEVSTGAVVLKRVEGSGSNVPESVSWDGKSDSGAIWPEGEYQASLSIDYGSAFNPARVTSQKFKLISSSPTVRIGATPQAFTPEGEGMREGMTLALDAKAPLASIASWTVTVQDQGGRRVRAFLGTGPSGQITWDGKSDDGSWLAPGLSCLARVVAVDEYGNRGETSLPIEVRDRGTAPEASLVDTDTRGLSPAIVKNGGAAVFTLKVGSKDRARSWKVEIAGGSPRASRVFSGTVATLPSELAWDGRDESGAIMPEGSYAATLTVDYGRTFKPATTRSKDIVLAVTPPTARISASPERFVPSEAGVTAPLSLVMDARPGSAKILAWTVDILDAQGRVARSFTRSWPANQAVWDGTLDSGAFVEPATEYGIRAVIADEYGNSTTTTTKVLVSEVPAATEPSLVEPRSGGFSPVAETKPASIDFFLVAGNAELMKSWKLVVSHAERGAQWSQHGDAASFNRSISWNGHTEAGAIVPDGSYFATLSIDYGKSFKPATAKSGAFSVQAAPPEASVSLSPQSLTPQAGTFERPVTIGLKASSRFGIIENRSVAILDANGNTVRFFRDFPGQSISWDGMTASGQPAEPSSSYTVLFDVVDSFGNPGSARASLPVADLPPVPGANSIQPTTAGFSPNGDGVADTLDLALTVANRSAVSAWKATVTDQDNVILRSFSGTGSNLAPTVTWLGRSDSGLTVPEGSYLATLTVEYGSTFKTATATSRRFVLSLTPPEGSLAAEPRAVVPDATGLVAPAQIRLDAKSGLARLASWKIAVLDSRGTGFSAWEGAWPPNPVTWTGVAADGRIAEPGASYLLTASVRDEFGVSTTIRDHIEVGALPAPTEASTIAAQAKGFSTMARGQLKFSLAFGNANLIRSRGIAIERDDRTVRLDFPGKAGPLPESFNWDGRLQDGTPAPDGYYSAVLSIDYGRTYSRARVDSGAFTLASARPEIAVAVDPALFSPDGDAIAETCTITVDAKSRYAAISDWSVDISDPAGNAFRSFKGQGPITPILWDGRGDKGDTVESAEDYPVTVRVRDEFGNASEARATSRIDILLVRVGEGYRIRVSSIVFKAYTADWTDVPPDRASRNIATLNLLADKLKKFPGYQIRMQGHAVMINWDDPAKGKLEQEKELVPLSRARAGSIRQALVERGIEAARMTADGVGAQDPIVPDSDLDNRWKNRRVEFFLEKRK